MVLFVFGLLNRIYNHFIKKSERKLIILWKAIYQKRIRTTFESISQSVLTSKYLSINNNGHRRVLASSSLWLWLLIKVGKLLVFCALIEMYCMHIGCSCQFHRTKRPVVDWTQFRCCKSTYYHFFVKPVKVLRSKLVEIC